MSQSNLFYGWFEDAGGAKAFDPPHDGPCVLCGRAIDPATDVRTHSVMAVDDYAPRSYFYRTHRTCADRHGDEAATEVILRMIERNGD